MIGRSIKLTADPGESISPLYRIGGHTGVFIFPGNTLFRLTGNGGTVTATSVSHDTLAVLPESGDEVLICTPAYAYRVTSGDFTRP